MVTSGTLHSSIAHERVYVQEGNSGTKYLDHENVNQVYSKTGRGQRSRERPGPRERRKTLVFRYAPRGEEMQHAEATMTFRLTKS